MKIKKAAYYLFVICMICLFGLILGLTFHCSENTDNSQTETIEEITVDPNNLESVCNGLVMALFARCEKRVALADNFLKEATDNCILELQENPDKTALVIETIDKINSIGKENNAESELVINKNECIAASQYVSNLFQ